MAKKAVRSFSEVYINSLIQKRNTMIEKENDYVED